MPWLSTTKPFPWQHNLATEPSGFIQETAKEKVEIRSLCWVHVTVVFFTFFDLYLSRVNSLTMNALLQKHHAPHSHCKLPSTTTSLMCFAQNPSTMITSQMQDLLFHLSQICNNLPITSSLQLTAVFHTLMFMLYLYKKKTMFTHLLSYTLKEDKNTGQAAVKGKTRNRKRHSCNDLEVVKLPPLCLQLKENRRGFEGQERHRATVLQRAHLYSPYNKYSPG